MSNTGRKPTLAAIKRKDDAGDLTPTGVALAELPSPPSYFGSVAKRAYGLIISELAEMRAISSVDTLLIVPAARALERWFDLDQKIVAGEAEELEPANNGKLFMSGTAQARAAAISEFRKLCGDLGIGPANRFRIQGTAQTDFLDLLGAPKPKAAEPEEREEIQTDEAENAPTRDDPFKPISNGLLN